MSTTEPVDAAPPPNPFEDGIPFGTKLQELAEQRRDDPAVTVVAPDGNAQSLTFGELDAGANQWGRALAASGADGFLCRTGNPEFTAPGARRAGLLEDRRGPDSDALGPARLGA